METNIGKAQEINSYLTGIGDFVRNTIHRCDYDWDFDKKLSLYDLATFFVSYYIPEEDSTKSYNCGELFTQYIQNEPVRSGKFIEHFGQSDSTWYDYFNANIRPKLQNKNILESEDALEDFLYAIFEWGLREGKNSME